MTAIKIPGSGQRAARKLHASRRWQQAASPTRAQVPTRITNAPRGTPEGSNGASGWLLRLMVVLGLLLTAPTLHAEVAERPIPVPTPVVAVTLYPNTARIERQAVAQLPAGPHELELTGLPGGVQAETLQLSAQGPAGTTLGLWRLETRPQPRRAHPAEQSLRDQLKTLGERQAESEDALAAAAFRQRLAEESLKALSAPRDAPLPERFGPLWAELRDELTAGQDEARTARQQQTELAEQRAVLERQLAEISGRDADRQVLVVPITLGAAGEVRLELRYLDPRAGWQPGYRAALDTQNARFHLEQAALAHQNSGEDWTDVEMTVSTRRPGRWQQLPPTQPWQIGLQPPVALMEQRMEQRIKAAPAPAMLARNEAVAGASDGAATEPVAELEAEAVDSGFELEFKLPGRVSLPQGRAATRLPLARHDLPSELAVVIAPRFGATPLLRARSTWPGPGALPAGGLQLQRDGTDLARTRLPALPPGARLELPFGEDDRIEIKREVDPSLAGDAGLIGQRRRERRAETLTLTNHHTTPMTLEVQWNLPIATDNAIRIEPLRDLTPGFTRDADGVAGLLRWTRTLKPDEAWTLRYGFEVTWPADQTLSGL